MSRNLPSIRAAGITLATLLLSGALAMVCEARPADTPAADADPYIWLETVDSPRVNSWVAAENARTVSRLEADPRLKQVESASLAILESRDRIAEPAFVHGQIYNLWQDRDHHQGLWRRTSVASYLTTDPKWEPVLDIDALSAADKVNWVVHGTDCPRQAAGHCLISLSAGGEDASRDREFDLATRSFVPGGFDLPRSKQRVAWQDKDTLLVVRDWGPGSLTTSGYGFVVKQLRRGQPLDQAREVFRGTEQDGGYGVTPVVLTDGAGHRLALISRPLSTFEFETWVLTRGGVKKLALPLKSEVADMVDGQLIVTLKTDWTPAGSHRTFTAGTVVSLDVEALKQHPDHLQPVVVFAPNARQSVESVAATRSRLIITWLDTVQARGATLRYVKGAWQAKPLALPDNSAASIRTTNDADDRAFLETTSFLQPPTLWLADTRTAALKAARSLPPKFSAEGLVSEQFMATSRDGTRVPYFIVHSRKQPLDGSTPTLMTAYGGFDASETPYYLGSTGKIWLERGGAFVLANIRGGGEFGPAWHEAGLKTHRQVIYDDFAAVAQDLFKRGITSPRRLGIRGGSNGGLLMGVQLTQHPDYWNAVIIDVPLLDMLRFEQIAAGTSWVGEYGSVSVPEERAFLAGISPYHNLKTGVKYPEPFIFTTTKDDRVGPQHARKFAARMSEMGLPYLYYELTEGGHGAGANLAERARTQALEMTYLIQKLMD
jgi:prolyl oligopeptidase